MKISCCFGFFHIYIIVTIKTSNMKKYITVNIDKEVIKEFKIIMAKLELNNKSIIIENLIKEWIEKNKC